VLSGRISVALQMQFPSSYLVTHFPDLHRALFEKRQAATCGFSKSFVQILEMWQSKRRMGKFKKE
jgi:hypothetical protein